MPARSDPNGIAITLGDLKTTRRATPSAAPCFKANAQEAADTTIRLRVGSPAPTSRSCGGCTACCDGWLKATIRGHEMRPGTPCRFRGAGRCTIYADRPADPCRKFRCGWLLPASHFPDSFRPDRLGVIFVPKKWRDAGAFMVVAAGRVPDDPLVAYLKEVNAKSGLAFAFASGEFSFVIGSPEFREDMRAKLERGEPML